MSKSLTQSLSHSLFLFCSFLFTLLITLLLTSSSIRVASSSIPTTNTTATTSTASTATAAEIDLILTHRRRTTATANPASYACDPDSVKGNAGLDRYFDGMWRIYKSLQDSTCLPVHKACGWPTSHNPPSRKSLPLMVLSVGLEGAGHHLWTEMMAKPLFDCVWINARHYRRDVGDGVARTSPEELKAGFQEQVL